MGSPGISSDWTGQPGIWSGHFGTCSCQFGGTWSDWTGHFGTLTGQSGGIWTGQSGIWSAGQFGGTWSTVQYAAAVVAAWCLVARGRGSAVDVTS